MPRLGTRSRENLDTCDRRLVEVCHRVIEIVDFAVVEGHRGQELQELHYAEGRSKVRWPNGAHNQNPSKAVHLLPWPFDSERDWLNFRHFDQLAGIVRGVSAMLGIRIRWGGDWDCDWDLHDQSFNDLLHYELRPL